MDRASKSKQRWFFYLQALLLGVLAFVFTYHDIFYALDSFYRDRFYQRSRGVNQSVKIIAIDEKTLNAYGPFGTWDRSVYADILDTLGDYPSVVGFDIMFFGEMTKEGDAAFVKAASKNDNVVLVSHIDFDTVVEEGANGEQTVNTFHVTKMEMPITEDKVSTGYANMSPDSDGIVRRVLPQFTDSNSKETYSSFSYTIYRKYCEQKGIVPVEPELDDNGTQWIYYAGKPFDYEAISMVDVVEGKVDPRVFTDCIVLVGAYATGL